MRYAYPLMSVQVSVRERTAMDGQLDLQVVAQQAPAILNAMRTLCNLLVPALDAIGPDLPIAMHYGVRTDEMLGDMLAEVRVIAIGDGAISQELVEGLEAKVADISCAVIKLAAGQRMESGAESKLTMELQSVARAAERFFLSFGASGLLLFEKEDFVRQ